MHGSVLLTLCSGLRYSSSGVAVGTIEHALVRSSQSLQPYGFLRIFKDFLPLIRVYGRNVPNTEYGRRNSLPLDRSSLILVIPRLKSSARTHAC